MAAVVKQASIMRVELEGELDGHHIVVNLAALTMGLLEDIQGGRTGPMLDAVAATLASGDIPTGTTREGLRSLTPSAFADLCAGVAGCITLRPKSG